MHSREIFQRPRYIFMFIISVLLRCISKREKRMNKNKIAGLQDIRALLIIGAKKKIHCVSDIWSNPSNFVVLFYCCMSLCMCAKHTLAFGICGTSESLLWVLLCGTRLFTIFTAIQHVNECIQVDCLILNSFSSINPT